MMQARQRARVWLIATQSIYLLSLIPWLAVAGLAVMAFDAPGSTEQWGPWMFAGAIWSYPLWLVVFSLAAWVLYIRGRLRGAVVATWLPAAVGILLVIGLAVLMAVTSLA